MKCKYPIIGINGKMGAGKDLIADILCIVLKMKQLNVVKDAFANPLKEILMNYFGFTKEDLYTQDGKMRMNNFWGMTNREAAQRFGTEAIRNGFHTEAWTKAMELRIAKSDADVTLLPDTRFPNECKFIRDNGGIVIKVVRNRINPDLNAAGIKNHPSEADLPDWMFDLTIENNGTLEDLFKQVIKLVETQLMD